MVQEAEYNHEFARPPNLAPLDKSNTKALYFAQPTIVGALMFYPNARFGRSEGDWSNGLA
jgi:hypothetical protein